jgi:hypothetical protein
VAFKVLVRQSSEKRSRVWQVARTAVLLRCSLYRLNTAKLGGSPEKALQ